MLIGCEESQSECHEFIIRGHDCWSCDIKPSSGEHPERHIQGDLLEVIHDGWDMAIFHPPCTFLANSGVQHLHKDPERWDRLDEACEFFVKLMMAPIEKIAIENPIPHKYAVARLPKSYDQCIQPHQFGIPENKAICYWLKNLPPLMSTIDARAIMARQSKAENNRIHYMPPGPERQTLRSKSYQPISAAMADQWGNYD